MVNSFKKLATNRAFTLMELVMVIAILGIFATFAVVAFGDADEQKDVRAFNSVQATLQSVEIQGAERTNSRPQELAAATIIAAMPPHAFIDLTVTNETNILAIANRGLSRTVEFATNACGDVCMVNITGFVTYGLQPLPKQDCNEPGSGVTPCNYLAGS